MNMILLARPQVTKTVKNCFIKMRFAHQKLDDNEGDDVGDNGDIINKDDWNLTQRRDNF